MAQQKIKRTVARHNARGKAMQALYQIDMAGGSSIDVIKQFLETQEMDRVDIDYFQELITTVVMNGSELDGKISECLDRKLDGLDAVERSILRLAAAEMQYCLDVPYKVVINEAVELAKKYGAEQGHKYVNGVVDKLARNIRTIELQANQQKK